MIRLPLADFKEYPTILSACTLLECFYFIHFIPLLHCISRAIIVLSPLFYALLLIIWTIKVLLMIRNKMKCHNILQLKLALPQPATI